MELPMINKLTEVPNNSIYNNVANDNRTWSLGKRTEDEIKFRTISTCRETLLNEIIDNNLNLGNWLVYRTSSAKRASNSVKFIKQVEKKLIKKKEDRSQICSVGNSVCINLEGFWKSPFRIGILTMLIRAGIGYDKKTFAKCLKSGEYFRNKRMLLAAKTFLSGKINISKFGGKDYFYLKEGFWVQHLYYSSENEIKRSFKKTKIKN